MKKVLALVISYFLFMSSVVASAHAHDFKAAVDEFNFKISVLWDQEDKAFYLDAVKEFESKLNELKSSGLTNEDAFEVIAANLNNEQAKKEMLEFMQTISQQDLTEGELVNLIKDYSVSLQSTGANFNGSESIGNVGGTLLVLALVGGAIFAGWKVIDALAGVADDVYDDDDYYDDDNGSYSPTYTANYTYTCSHNNATYTSYIVSISQACLEAEKFYAKTMRCNEIDNMTDAYARCDSACGNQGCTL